MLNRWQRTIVDLRGNVVCHAQQQIFRKQTKSSPTINREKTSKEIIPNAIVTANQNGYAYFYAPADLYRIRSTQPSIDWRDVDLGSAAAQQLAQQALDNAVPTYETLVDMQADTGQPVPTLGRVVNDSTLEDNGYYVWTGSAWERAAYQPLRDMDVSIEPAPSKIPRATGDGVIRKAWVEDLPFNYDQIYAQLWLARYPGIPAPSFYQEFGGGASLLDPRITFSRPSKAWSWRNGVLVEYDVDEPVFEEGGLRLEPRGTNYVQGTGDMYANWKYQIAHYDSAPAESVFGAGYTAIEYTKISTSTPFVNLVGDIPSSLLGWQVSVTVLLEADLGALQGDSFKVSLYNYSARVEHTTRTIDYQVGTDNGISLEILNSVGPNGHPLYRIHAEFEVPDDDVDIYRCYIYMIEIY